MEVRRINSSQIRWKFLIPVSLFRPSNMDCLGVCKNFVNKKSQNMIKRIFDDTCSS